MENVKKFPAESIFAELKSPEIRKLEESAAGLRFTEGEWVVQAGEVWPYFFFITQGEIVAVKESFEGRSLTLTTLHAGDVFWGLAFFLENALMPASLRAVQDTKILNWPREVLLPYFLENGYLSWELSCLMIRRVQLASEIVDKLAFQPVAGRLARLLVEFAGEMDGKAIARNLTLDEMAARIGTTREVVSRFLHRFSDQKLIDITRTEFSVTDRRGLEELARRSKG